MAKKTVKTKKKAAPPAKKKIKPAAKAPVKASAKSKKSAPAKKAAKKSSPPKKIIAPAKKKPAKVVVKKAPAKKSAPVKKAKPAPVVVKKQKEKVKPVAKQASQPDAKVPAAKAMPAKKAEKIKAPAAEVPATGKKKKDAEPDKPKTSSRKARHVVLPRPPMFPRKFEEPLPALPKITGNKKQFKIEFEIKASPRMLYNYLSTPSGLGAWFANNVNIRDDVYTFFWDGSTARAKVIARRDTQYICFQWLDETDFSWFLFEIVQDEITGDVALIVTDFAFPGETEQNMRLWHSQINALLQVIGS